jgi:hypothetical protein
MCDAITSIVTRKRLDCPDDADIAKALKEINLDNETEKEVFLTETSCYDFCLVF